MTASGWITSCDDRASWLARLSNYRQVGECHVWQGRLDRYGYGVFRVGRRQTGAHRAMWLAARGPIAYPLVIDHLCRNRACVNVDHLAVVTNAENLARGSVADRAGQHRGLTGRLKEVCVHGHPFDEVNTRWSVRRDGYLIRVCRACEVDRRERFLARRAVA